MNEQEKFNRQMSGLVEKVFSDFKIPRPDRADLLARFRAGATKSISEGSSVELVRKMFIPFLTFYCEGYSDGGREWSHPIWLGIKKQTNERNSMKTLKVKLKFTEVLLGTASNNPDLQREYVASKSPNPETVEPEVAAVTELDADQQVEEAIRKAKTVFPKEDGKPYIYDYQVKGFFKDACGMLARVPETLSGKVKAYKKVVDGIIFVFPRKIFLQMPEGTVLGEYPRPIRVETAQGPRVALTNSETAPAGTVVEFEVRLLDDRQEPLLKEWLDYGALRGLGGWRNGGNGRFEWEELGAVPVARRSKTVELKKAA